MDALLDQRSGSLSVLLTMRYPVYREIIECAYDDGGLREQRDTLRSSTAIQIRKRMIADIGSGAVLPPIVLGVAEDGMDYVQFQTMQEGADKIC